MRRTDGNLSLCTAAFVTMLVISNVLASKVITLGPFELPAAVVAYPVTFLMTDIIGEIWGRSAANRTVRIGMVCQIASLVCIYLAVALPPAPYMEGFQQEYSDVLSSTGRMVFASLLAYICAQTWDVFVFHALKDRDGSSRKWVRNNLSTMTSQMIDTAIFITIAFWGVVPDIALMIISQYIVKSLIALCDTPFFYLLTHDSGVEDRWPTYRT